ncbi:hypothetical protein [Levilactobacillus yonginensis]|uniref:hypothetical protein n=1 Tax=Levilactobacillus yonginensis TaxID=1054041 RepID=UPI001CDB6031|nr:hypothetical protein [Levilactobacillus yonginensis]
MQSSLKKSLYLGLAALSFSGVAAVSTTASAKSYATAGAYTSLEKTDATKRNVESTGTNALYTKPGTVKGAKVVASKATMAKLASSKKSADYFRVYGQKTTNRGSVYYRVVTMNGKYRGYIYGGKTAGTFAGGIKSAETTTDKTATDPTVGKTVTFTTPGKTNVTWTAPKYTQYKASKNVVSTEPFAGDTLKVTKAATKTREGSLYYYVEDAQHPSVSGWIYSKAVTTDTSVAFNQAKDVKVNFVAADGSVIKSTTLKGLTKNNDANNAISNPAVSADSKGQSVGYDVQKQATAAWGNPLLTGTGYTYDPAVAGNAAAIVAAKTGDTLNLTVTKGDQVVMGLQAYVDNGVAAGTQLTTTAADDTKLPLQISAFPKVTAAFAGATGADYAASDVYNFLSTNGATKMVSVDYAKDDSGTVVATDAATAVKANGKVVLYHTVYTLERGVKGTYAKDGKAQAFYTANEVKGTGVTTDTGSNGNGSSVFD